ncbi:hypothetical protein QAD02_021992, partial [Eretmocerus hayati]
INIEADLESQGPIDVFFHKLADFLSRAKDGDEQAKSIVSRVKNYIFKHPELIVIDPLENVEILTNRYESYKMILDGFRHDDQIFIPNFAYVESSDTSKLMDDLKNNGIRFPCVCKPLIAHGSSDAHKLMVIFNERGLSDCQPPCVAQNMINHSAVLYKLFIVDDYFQIVERPSIRNFYSKDCDTMKTIFFKSHDVCKKGSNSKWSVISSEEKALAIKPRHEIFVEIVKRVKKIFNLVLVGVDVVIDNRNGKYAVIDINAFPGYDGYPDFFKHLIVTVKKQLKEKKTFKRYPVLKKCLSDDLDSGFESDEKRKLFRS